MYIAVTMHDAAHPSFGWCCIGPATLAAAVHASQLKQPAPAVAAATAACPRTPCKAALLLLPLL
jgi:hypothetical protein